MTQFELFMKLFVFQILFIGLVLLQSCNNSQNVKFEKVLNSQLNIPNQLSAKIGECNVEYNIINNKYTIITLIDTDNCPLCQLHLKEWETFMAKLQSRSAKNIGFVVVMCGDNHGDRLSMSQFNFPVIYDLQYEIMRGNSEIFSISETILLDEDKRILAMGNPVLNPKIRKIYSELIELNEDNPLGKNEFNSAIHFVDNSKNLGVLYSGDSVSITYTCINHDSVPICFEDIVTSCGCIMVKPFMQKVEIDDYSQIVLSFKVDSITGQFKQYADVYFENFDWPERVCFYGYVLPK